jgi:hypothetical protein
MSVIIPITDPVMMMIKEPCCKCALTALFTLLILPLVHAQQNDFQCWPSVQFGLSVSKNVKLHVEEEIRFKENCTQLARQINDLGISIKLNKNVRTALFYRVESDSKNADNYQWRQGFYTDLLFRYTPGRFLLGYRTRLQSARIEFNEKQIQLLGKLVNRHKFKAAYNLRNFPLTPFAEGELFFQFDRQQYNMSDLRAWIGLDYTPGKTHEFSLKYGFDREYMTADPLTSYIVAFNYTVNLKL